MINWVCNSRHVSGKPACCLCKYLPYRTIKLALLLLSCYCHILLFLYDSLLLPFMEPEVSSQSPQGSATSPHSKPHELNSSFHVLLFKVNFNIILPYIKWFLPFRLSHWRLIYISCTLHVCYIPKHFHSPNNSSRTQRFRIGNLGTDRK